MTSKAGSVVPNFDRLAGAYRWLEYLTFGPLLWRCRVRFLPRLSQCRQALILGDGDGRFTAALLRANPDIRAHAVDLSPRMLRELESGAGRNKNRVTTEIADLRIWRPASGVEFDLIVSHFFLDCLSSEEVASLAGRLAANSGAIWVVSDFAAPSTLFGRLIATPIITGLYFAFRLLTGLRQQSLPDHQQSLSAAGWLLKEEDRQVAGLLLSQLWRRPAIPNNGSAELK